MTFQNKTYRFAPNSLSSYLQRILLLMILPVTLQADPALTEAQLWQQLQQPGHFLMMRSARAPGFGDPANFDLADCTTQRNLSDDGEKHASRIGDALRQHGINSAQLFVSQWCRTQDTARLLMLGAINTLAALDKLPHGQDSHRPQQEALDRWISSQTFPTPTMLITHQANITAKTGVHTRSGDLVVLEKEAAGNVTVLGTLHID
tara:strand:+ start:6438 stop:7052 length:615 start_codon:yes stop_codon:yes gene_type:complete